MINSKETLTLLLDHVYANVKKDVDVRYVTLDSLIYKTHDDVFVWCKIKVKNSLSRQLDYVKRLT